MSRQVTALIAKRAAAQADLDRLKASGETQLSTTDVDARLLSKSGQTLAGYNVQVVVDNKQKLIVASAVVNDGNDTDQLHKMAQAAKQALGADAMRRVWAVTARILATAPKTFAQTAIRFDPVA